MLWIGIAAVVVIALLLVLMGRGGEKPAEARPVLPDAAPPEKLTRAAASAAAEPVPAATQGARASVPPEARRNDDRVSDPPPRPEGGDLAPEDVRGKAAHHPPPKTQEHHDDDVSVELRDDEDDDPSGPIPMILVTAVGRTDAGKRRKHNEDSYVVLPDHNVFVIADGMGGYAAGEVASQMAVDTIAEAFRTKKFEGEIDPFRPRRGDELVRAIEMANRAILSAARADESKSGMGTTLVSARFSLQRQRVHIAHVGDSRLYRVRKGEIKQLTTDHTLGSLGIVGPTAAKLTRAVGIQDEVEVDLLTESAEVGDQYIICSDGLSKMISDELMQKIIVETADLEQACQNLINRANEAGGRDNVTVILIRIERPIPKSA